VNTGAEHISADHDGEHHLDPKLVYDMSRLGMWLFLATEILLFGGLFTTYGVYRLKFPEMWSESSGALSVPFGAANTIILLASSFSAAWAVDAIKRNQQKLVSWLLLITIALGAAFMVNKFFEYSHKTHEITLTNLAIDPTLTKSLVEAGKCTDLPKPSEKQLAEAKATKKKVATKECRVVPFAAKYVGHPNEPVFANLYFVQYFIMTGIHGLHIIIGLGLFGWILLLNLRGKLTSDWFTPVEIGGLYWHLVDLIWIYLFPLLYLVG